jgi:uncharacterized protein YxjI
MEFPLTLSFRIMTVAPQFVVRDSTGRVLFSVRQKLFRLRESVSVFADAEQTQPVASIEADRMIDFSARYHFRDNGGRTFGAVQRNGMRSLWKADYSVLRGDDAICTIREESALVKVMDGFLLQIPVLNLLSGYVFHPSYLVTRPDERPVLRVRKEPAFLESRFRIDRLSPLEGEEEGLVVMAILMMTLLERSRG